MKMPFLFLAIYRDPRTKRIRKKFIKAHSIQQGVFKARLGQGVGKRCIAFYDYTLSEIYQLTPVPLSGKVLNEV